MKNTTDSIRLDKWLWAARFYKTRQLAVKGLKNGKISLNKQSVKPASSIRAGDRLIIKRGLHETEVEVFGLSEKRGSATIAQTLYSETEASIAARQKLEKELASQPKIDIDQHKPDKRGVRSHRALKRGE